jgi:hypothetical protein
LRLTEYGTKTNPTPTWERRRFGRKCSTLDERIREHEAKILVERALGQPNEGRVRHWEAEILAFRSAIDRARRRLGEMP